MSAAAALIGFAVVEADPRHWLLLRNTVLLGTGTCLLAVPLGTALAILVFRTDVAGRRLALAVLVAWLFMPMYLQAAAWDAWLGRQGWLWRGPEQEWGRWASALWIHGAAAIPWVTIIVGAGLRQIPPEWEEMALLDRSAAGVLWSVTLPLARPAVLVAAWWVFLMAAGEMTVTDLYQVRTLAEEIYSTLPLLTESELGSGETPALPRGTGLVTAMTLLTFVFATGFASYGFLATARPGRSISVGGWSGFLGVLLGMLLATIALVPLANLGLDAGWEVVPAGRGEVVRQWSGEKLLIVLAHSPWNFRRELGWTLVIAGGTASAATAVAAPLAWLARRRTAAAWPVFAVVSLAAATPGPCVALAVIAVMNREASEFSLWLYDRTIAAPLIAGAVRALPVAFLVCWWGCRTVANELVDLARLDGLGFWRQLAHLAWPLRRGMFAAAWLAAAAVAVGDLGATLLVTPPGINTLSLRIFGLLHAGVDDQVAGICLANVLICAGLAWASLAACRWQGGRE